MVTYLTFCMSIFISLQNMTYTLTVIATDNGQPDHFNTTAQVTVVVFSPDNHFNPELDQSSYDATVVEGNATEQVVVMFTVTDLDRIGPASELSAVELLGDGRELFNAEIIPGTNTGRVTTR